MKKLVKKLAVIFAAGALLGALAGCSNILLDDEETTDGSARSAISNTVTYTTSPEIFNLVCEGYNEGTKGPIIITKGKLKSGFSSKTVYLITLSGTDNVANQSTGYVTDLLSGFCLNNAYLENVVSIVNKNIPKNSNIILAGHSLGGMICQQVAADDSIKANYNVLNTVCFGSSAFRNPNDGWQIAYGNGYYQLETKHGVSVISQYEVENTQFPMVKNKKQKAKNQFLQAIIQQYNHRLINNQLTP